jgi:hypothetical protein
MMLLKVNGTDLRSSLKVNKAFKKWDNELFSLKNQVSWTSFLLKGQCGVSKYLS